MCTYASSNQSGHNFIIANQDKTIQVYNEFNLVWAAKVASVPVQVAVNNFGTKRGLIVTIDDTGMLNVSYLGTKPPVNAVATNNNKRDIDYDKIDEEHRSLLQVLC